MASYTEERKTYYETNKEKIKAYYQENREYLIERQKKYNIENKEKITQYYKEYFQKNKEKIYERIKNNNYISQYNYYYKISQLKPPKHPKPPPLIKILPKLPENNIIKFN